MSGFLGCDVLTETYDHTDTRVYLKEEFSASPITSFVILVTLVTADNAGGSVRVPS